MALAVEYRVVFDASQQYVDWSRLSVESGVMLVVAALLFSTYRLGLVSRTQWVAGSLVLALGVSLWWLSAWYDARVRSAAATALAVRSQWGATKTWGFTQTVQMGGPMRAGLQVRIRHVGANILKLEIARDG